MKKIIYLFIFILFGAFTGSAQEVVFHENFEMNSLDDSVSYYSTPTSGYIWNINTRLHHGATSFRSDSCQVKGSTTIYMTTNSFNTLGNTYVTLSFSQICKVDFLDIATIEVSNNGGGTWTQLTGAQYTGQGLYGTNGNRFSSNSYNNLWVPGTATAMPNNTWWRLETFDISSLVGNTANAKIRFKLADGGVIGPNGNKGWYIDNIAVNMAPSELNPPVIILVNPYPQGTIYSLGPFTIKAKITDPSAIDTAYIVYSVNGGTDDTVGMVHTLLDTMVGVMPAVGDSSEVCWHVEAFDNSLAHNLARNPLATCITFNAYGGITFPFYDNFDVNTSLFTPSYGGTNQQSTWQIGTPAYQSTTGAHSPPNAWDVNLSAVYQDNGYCILTSPVFDFSNAVNARLAFWINYYVENCCDGTRMEYTTNGTTWQLLGDINYPWSENWYNKTISSTNQPAWAGPESGPSGWKKCKLKLSMLNNVTGQVRFRYIFNSDGSLQRDGVSIDDFSITLPSPQEVMLESIVSPTTGFCGMGNETVSIKIINTGINPITGGLKAGFKKAAWATPVLENIPDNINPGDTLTYTFTTPINLSAVLMDSTFNIKVWVHLDADPNTGDDTLVTQIISKFVPPAPLVSNAYISYGTNTILTATSASSVKWYDALSGGNLLFTGSTYTTPILYDTTIYYPEATAVNGCIGPRASDTVFVGQAPPNDGASLALVAPISGINLPNNALVTSQLKNYGTQPMSGFPVSYKINNLPATSEICTDTIQPGNTLNYTFTAVADLSAYATYHFKSWLDVPGDVNQINDTVSKDITNSMHPYCNSRALYTTEGDIGNITISNVNNGNADSIFNNSTAIEKYTNYTQTTPIYLSRGQDYNFSLTGIYNTATHYTCYAKVFIDWNYDGIFDEVTETALSCGPTTASNTTITGVVHVPVSANLGLTMFRVVYRATSSVNDITPCNTYSYGETEDYLAMIMPQLSIDAGITGIPLPPAIYPQGYSGVPTINVKNNGYNEITTLDAYYQVDNNPVQSLTWNGSLLANTTTSIAFPSAVFDNGHHELCAWIHVVSDSNAYNDTLCKVIFGVPVDTLPYYDNFDGTSYFIPSTTSTTNWVLGAPASGNFPTSVMSSPNVWCTNLNTTGYDDGANCYLTTQIFDFTNAINAKISFWSIYNTETNYDGTRLEYSLDGGTVWHILGEVGDPLGTNWYTNDINSSNLDAWAGTSNAWIKSSYLLSEFNQCGTVRFRFVFTSDGSVSAPTYKGTAIDDFKITIPYHKDAGVDLFYAPTGIADAGSQLQVEVRLNNFGMDPMTTTDISYRVDNAAPVTETWTGNLAPGDSVTYTFFTTYTVPQGTYNLKSFTSLPQDGDHVNDTARTELFGLPVYIVPYIDNFDSATGFWYTTGNLWEHGSPTSSVIDHPYTSPYCWKTNLDGTYPHSSMQYLYSPKFDFSIAGMDTLKFMNWLHTNANDWGRVEYLASDQTWKTLGNVNDPNGVNWYNIPAGWSNDTNDYMLSKYDLKIVIDYAIPTQFRWAFNPYTFNNNTWNGWAVDNMEFTFPKIQIDAGVTSVIQPTGTTTYGTDILVKAVIKNFGWDTLTNVPVKFMINGITVAGGFYAGPLLPDSSVVFTFNPMPSPLQDYTLCVYTDVNFDTYYFNDSSCQFIHVVPPPYELELNEITSPILQTIYGDSATVSVNIKNNGLNPVSDIPVIYTIQDTLIVVNETWHGTSPLQPNESLSYSFNQKYLFPAFGFYQLCVYLDHPDDGHRSNDTICQRLESHYTDIPEIGGNGLFLLQNVPNPADALTQIKCILPAAGVLDFKLVNHMGQAVLTRNEKVNPGEYIFELDTKKMSPGIYYYFINFEGQQLAKKMIINH